MTVINTMLFGENKAVIVADEQASSDRRKYLFANKIKHISLGDIHLLIAGIGNGSILYECECEFETELKSQGIGDIKESADLLAKVMQKIRYITIDNYLQTHMGISYKEFQSGLVLGPNGVPQRINDGLQARFFNILDGKEVGQVFDNLAITVLGYDGQKVELHNVDMNHGSRIDYDKPYSSLGPGSDESDRILYGYINSLSRDQRRCIDPIEGFKKLVLATYKSSKVNLDVGGIPNIYLMTGQDDNPVKRFSERDSLLLTEIVRASSKGFISEDESTGLYGEIIEGCDFDTCEDRLIRLAGERKKELELFLRGYK